MPLLARLGFDRLVTEAGYPGSAMVPAPRALRSLLALKLLDKERRSHIDDFNCDEALGLFAGLNVLPKKSFATDYSYRAVRAQQLGLLQGWVKALAPVMFPASEGFSLDFHPIPFRGDPEALVKFHVTVFPRRKSLSDAPWARFSGQIHSLYTSRLPSGASCPLHSRDPGRRAWQGGHRRRPGRRQRSGRAALVARRDRPVASGGTFERSGSR